MRYQSNPRFRNRVRELRKATGMKQAPFSQQVGIAQSTLSEIERNHVNPSGEVMVRLYDSLGWKPGDILYILDGSENNIEKAEAHT